MSLIVHELVQSVIFICEWALSVIGFGKIFEDYN